MTIVIHRVRFLCFINVRNVVYDGLQKYDIRNVNLQRNQKMNYNVWQFSYTVNCVNFVYDGLQKYDIRNVNLQRNQKMDYNV